MLLISITEYNDILTDMNMLIQEKLYKVKDKSTVTAVAQSPVNSANDGNMAIIVETAERMGLDREQIDYDLCAELEPDERNYFSINKAVPLIVEMSKKNGRSSRVTMKKTRGSTNTSVVDEHVGSRVKTVFEDGVEHGGEAVCTL